MMAVTASAALLIGPSGLNGPLRVPAVAAQTAVPVGASAFTPITPTRLVDTRSGLGVLVAAPIHANQQIDLQIAGAVVPPTATAVALNVTATRAQSGGWLSVFPSGGKAGGSSTLNLDFANQDVPNAAFLALGTGGRLSVFTSFTTDVLVDVFGYFTPAQSASSGRFVALTPNRILDTRVGLGWPAPASESDGQELITLQVTGRGGVPTTGVSAVIMNVTAADPSGSGYVQVAPTPVSPGTSSNLNTAYGRTSANLVVTPVSASGSVDLYANVDVDLLADVIGYFTDGSAESSNVGLFVRSDPHRQLDTRLSVGSRLAGGTSMQADVSEFAYGSVAAPASAVTGNLTATAASAGGWVQVAPPPLFPGASSNLNIAYDWQTVANAMVSPIAGGQLQLYTFRPAHLILDLTGWFTGEPVDDQPSTNPPVTNPPAMPPTPVMSAPVAVDGGRDMSCALGVSGAVACWGTYDAPTSGALPPYTIPGITDALEVAVGDGRACVRRPTGTVMCWWFNGAHGAIPGAESTSAPLEVAGITDVVALDVGNEACVVRQNGTVVCWGPYTDRPEDLPHTISGITDAVDVSAGYLSSCALRANGGVACWGTNLFGEFGNGTTEPSETSAVPVSGLVDATQVSIGVASACARRATTEVVCWGINGDGRLGSGDQVSSLVPVSVVRSDGGSTEPLDGVSSISVGDAHACALLEDGSVSCWGDDYYGQLGTAATPVRVAGTFSNVAISTDLGPGAAVITAGWNHTCALKAGQVWCWGYNAVGQLGDGTTTDRATPVHVAGLP